MSSSKAKKVKVTLVQALRLCTGRTAHRGSRSIALPFQDHGIRRGWEVSVTPRPLFTPGKDPVPIVREAGWAPRPVRKGAENLAPTWIRSPDRPVRSQSQYRLCYPVHSTWICHLFMGGVGGRGHLYKIQCSLSLGPPSVPIFSKPETWQSDNVHMLIKKKKRTAAP